MLNKKEITIITAVTIILAFVVSLVETLEIFLYTLASVFFVIIINITSKKITAFYLDPEIEIKLWNLKRLGLLYFFDLHPFEKTHPSKEFKNPFPAGAALPIITTAFSFGYFVWMASLIFDVKQKIYKAAKRHGLYSFSEMSEYHIGLIAASGILANLAFAVIGYLAGFSDFAIIGIYYAFFNILPLSELDGNKIFFGSLVLWSFLASLTLIALGYAFFLV